VCYCFDYSPALDENSPNVVNTLPITSSKARSASASTSSQQKGNEKVIDLAGLRTMHSATVEDSMSQVKKRVFPASTAPAKKKFAANWD